MRTSLEIYQRIQWDARFDPARFVVLIDVHSATPKRLPLTSFVPGGDIPWHRIIAFEADGELVWDRRSGIDRIDATVAGRRMGASSLRPPFWTKTSVSAAETPGVPRAKLRVVTWNTLWDRFDAERIATAQRRPLLLRVLRRADADVIALQEVEPELLAMLFEAPWVRSSYALSLGPDDDPRDVGGLVLLSRLPVVEAAVHALGPHKAVAAMTLTLVDDERIVVANVHLTSDHAERGAARRDEEIETLVGGLGTIDDLLLVGDFNDGNDDLAERLRMRDTWLEKRAPEPTFDPTKNPLAALASRTGRPARLDRVFVRGAGAQTAVVSLLGTEPQGGLFLSDHFGVSVDLELRDRSTITATPLPKTNRTALAWLPPRTLWPPIQAIREAHDPQLYRWPPHVNVLFGFVPEANFEEAAPRLTAALARVSPFRVALEGVRFFEHTSDATVWLDPTKGTTKEWSRLREALVAQFPGHRTDRTQPHLTLGKLDAPEKVTESWATRLGRHEAEVGELVLLSRRADEPMEVRATVTLGTGQLQWLDPPSTETTEPDVENALARIARALPDHVVHIAGSRRIGCALPGADLDLVIDTADPQAVVAALEPWFPDVRSRSRGSAPRAPHALSHRFAMFERWLEDARVPGIELRIGALDVDIALGDPAAMSGLTDADALIASVGGRRGSFIELARTVKRWARARGIDAAPFGGVPSIAWLVLAARTVSETTSTEPNELLTAFFARWAAWDWRQVVTLDPRSDFARASDEPMCIPTPTSPIRSTTSQVTGSMLSLLLEELYRGWQLCEAGKTGDLFALAPLHRRHRAWAIVEANDAQAAGALRGRMRALLGLLEPYAPHAWPHAFSPGRFAIGLGQSPPEKATLRDLVATWERSLPGVFVSWAEGSAVPTLRAGARPV
jgi:poly(A) polymerase